MNDSGVLYYNYLLSWNQIFFQRGSGPKSVNIFVDWIDSGLLNKTIIKLAMAVEK